MEVKIDIYDSSGSSEVVVFSPQIVFESEDLSVRPKGYFSHTVGVEVELILVEVFKMLDHGDCKPAR